MLRSSWFDAVAGRTIPYDDNGHGTHVTGTVLGQTPDLALGIAPGASWIAAKVLNAQGAGSLYSLKICSIVVKAMTPK